MCATSEQVNRFYMFFSCYVYIVCSGNSIHSVMCIVLWNIGWIERFTWISLRRRFNVLQRGNIWIKRKISKRRLVVEKRRSISIESKIWDHLKLLEMATAEWRRLWIHLQLTTNYNLLCLCEPKINGSSTRKLKSKWLWGAKQLYT